MILSIISIVLAIVAIVYCGHVAIVFQRFNDGIRDWSRELDRTTKDAIDRSARNLLRELDEKISSMKEEEPLNSNEDEREE